MFEIIFIYCDVTLELWHYVAVTSDINMDAAHKVFICIMWYYTKMFFWFHYKMRIDIKTDSYIRVALK